MYYILYYPIKFSELHRLLVDATYTAVDFQLVRSTRLVTVSDLPFKSSRAKQYICLFLRGRLLRVNT